MKTRSIILSFAFIIVSISSFAQNLGKKEKVVVDKFIAAVSANSEKKAMKCLDKAYAKEQLGNLNGNKKQLVDELLGGEDISNSDNYVNVNISEVTSIKLEQVVKLKGEDTYTIFFRVRKGDIEILASLSLRKTGRKYGFVGGLG